jgi:hypothetical protein
MSWASVVQSLPRIVGIRDVCGGTSLLHLEQPGCRALWARSWEMEPAPIGCLGVHDDGDAEQCGSGGDGVDPETLLHWEEDSEISR